MNGYPTDFGITECVKLCASNKYSDKRVAYLGITILVDESDQVLMLVTNSLKHDLVSHDMHTVALALNVLGDIASPEMVRELMPEIEKLMLSPNPVIRKKAGLAAVRTVRKLSAEETSNILALVPQYFDLKSPAVHMCGAALVDALCAQDADNVPELKDRVMPILLQLLHDVVMAGSSKTDRTVAKGNAFLKVKLISAIRVLIEASMPPSDVVLTVSEAITSIALKDEPTKIDGCAVLYECVRVAALLADDKELRTLAVRVLGKFLSHKEPTPRFIALQELTGLVDADGPGVLTSIEDHKDKILAGLHEADPTIRSQAVELICRIANSENVEEMVSELIEYVKSAESQAAVKDGCEKIFYLTDRFGTSDTWKIETFLTTLKIGDLSLSENLLLHLVNMITANPSLQPHAVRLLYDGTIRSAIAASNGEIPQETIGEDDSATTARKPRSEGVALYVLGEHGTATSHAGLTPNEVLNAFEKLLITSQEVEEEWLNTGKASFNSGNKALGEIALSALAKFASRSLHSVENQADTGLEGLMADAMGHNNKAPLLLTSGKETTTDLEASLFGDLDSKPTPSNALVPADPGTDALALIDDTIFGGDNSSLVPVAEDQNVVVNQVRQLLSTAAHSPDAERQQRACEYLAMLEVGSSSALAKVMAPIPAMASHELKFSTKPSRSRLRTQGGQATGNTALLLDLMDNTDVPAQGSAANDVPALPGLDDILALPSNEPVARDGGGLENLDDILSLGVGTAPTPSIAPSGTGSDLLSAIGGSSVINPGPSDGAGSRMLMPDSQGLYEFSNGGPVLTTMIVESESIAVEAQFFKDEQDSSSTRAEIRIINKTTESMSDAILQLAVPKYMQLDMQPASSSNIDAGAEATQTVSLVNNMHGTKPIQLRYRVEFKQVDIEDVVRLQGIVANLDPL